jgi:tetratricopeptide (TPR) repeat protein
MPCVTELTEFSRRESDLRGAGINILALNVDELMDDPKSDLARSKQILTKIAFPFAAAAVDAEHSGTLDLFHQAFLSLRRPLPIPSSFLATADGRVAVIYRGPLSIEQLLHDLELLDSGPESIRTRAAPFQGKWHTTPIIPDPKGHAMAFMRSGFLDQGAKYLETYLLAHLNKKGWGPPESWPTQMRLAELCDTLADFYRLRNEPEKVAGVYQIALKFDPEFVPSFMNLGKVMIGQGKTNEGLGLLQRAHRLAPSDSIITSDLAIAYAMTGRTKPAEQIFLRLLQQDSESSGTRLNLGRLYFQTRRFTEAAAQLRAHLKLEPNSAEALNLFCWILVSSPNDSDRDARLAQEYFTRLRRQAQEEAAESHDLLAALHAELGDFENAVVEARRAVQLAQKQSNESSVAEIEHRLQLYRNRQPFRLR